MTRDLPLDPPARRRPGAVEVTRPTADQATQIRGLVAAFPGAADFPQLSEAALLRLTSPAPVRHWVMTDDDAGGEVTGGETGDARLLGYAQLAPEGDDLGIELVTVPDRTDVAEGLLLAVSTDVGQQMAGRLLVWAHGSASPVPAVAPALGFVATRTLFQLRRSLEDLPDATDLAPGVTMRAFRPGEDDEAWLALNAQAFSHHPEQGGWTRSDLAERLAADWFDPAGFLVAERDGALIGFHWTKVHTDALDAAGTPLGEVYVLGVAPEAQGLHLGSSLLWAGLRYLENRGLRTVLLYVDEDNPTAVSLYRSRGFTTFGVDQQFVR